MNTLNDRQKQLTDILNPQFLPLHMPSPSRGRRRRKGSWVPAADMCTESPNIILPIVALHSYDSFFTNGVA
jgi:hypothetical protein